MLWRFLPFLLLSVLLVSCFPKYDRDQRPAKKVLGYKPVFSSDTSILRIVADTARPVKNAGKIYAFGQFIFQNELGEGVHVLDNSDPASLRNAGFIRIKGNSEISIKGPHLYANSFTDLVIVDISNWQQPKEVKRLPLVFRQGASVPGGRNFIPLPEKNVYYDCHQFSSARIQTGWQKDSILDNTCFYQQ